MARIGGKILTRVTMTSVPRHSNHNIVGFIVNTASWEGICDRLKRKKNLRFDLFCISHVDMVFG